MFSIEINFIIYHFVFLTLISSSRTEESQGVELSNMVQRLCLGKKLMPQHGFPERIVSEYLRRRIEKLTKKIPESIPSDQRIDVTKESEVGSYGQSINSNIIGTQQATVNNLRTLIRDQTNNMDQDSEVSELKLSSRSMVNVGREEKFRRQVPMENSGKLACERLIRDEFYRTFSRFRADNTRKIKDPEDSMNDSNAAILGNKFVDDANLIRKDVLSNENLADISVKEQTKINLQGDNIDFLQIGSGNSQNRVENAIVEEQSHSSFRRSKVSSITVSITPTIGL
ncbi:uncharacterized protein LOC141857947 [Brevipalpus obovatus]|uniref:uncharacterized protein LOC141857947 n=1 Tax=Brevipalpus obovatus TaxID=246614 RepID=UPI003D9EEFBA